MRRPEIMLMLTLAGLCIVAACARTEDDREHVGDLQPTATPTSVADPDHDDSPAPVQASEDEAASYESLDGRPCSWEHVVDPAPHEPFEDLAWISHQVAIGTVTEHIGPAWMEPDPQHSGHSEDCLQIMTDYEVKLEMHYRGETADPLRVRINGGELDGYEQTTDISPEIEPSDRLLLFLGEAPESDVLPDAWTALASRVWMIDDDNQVPGDEWLDDFDVLDLDTVDERIRDALGRQSHILGTRNVTDDEAPIHVEHDDEREPLVGAPCSFYVDYDLDPHPTVDELAWSSEHIVVGEVTELHGPDWAEPDIVQSWGAASRCLEIMNDYTIEVENRFHGEDVETMRIRGPGGELDGYEQIHGLAPDLDVGDRYLFFLFEAPASEMLPDAWAFDLQRARQVLSEDRVTTGHDEMMTLDEVEQVVSEALAGDRPPADERLRALWGSAQSPTFQEE